MARQVVVLPEAREPLLQTQRHRQRLDVGGGDHARVASRPCRLRRRHVRCALRDLQLRLARRNLWRRRCRCAGDGGGDGPGGGGAGPPTWDEGRRHGTRARPELAARRECPLRRSSPASWPPSGKIFFPPHSVSSIFVHELYLLLCQRPHAQLSANIIQYTSFRWALFAPFFHVRACVRATCACCARAATSERERTTASHAQCALRAQGSN